VQNTLQWPENRCKTYGLDVTNRLLLLRILNVILPLSGGFLILNSMQVCYLLQGLVFQS